VESLLIDDVMVEVKIVEEWGFKIEGSHTQSDNEDVPTDMEACNNINNFVDKIAEELEVEELKGKKQLGNVDYAYTQETNDSPVAVVNILKDSVEEDIESEGILHHLVHSLKKVARLPSKDRSAVMHALKKRVNKTQGSDKNHTVMEVVSQGNSNDVSSSVLVNIDWKHWVVLRGNDKVVGDDVWGIGKDIGVNFDGENHNIFSVISRAGKGKRESISRREKESGRSVGGGL